MHSVFPVTPCILLDLLGMSDGPMSTELLNISRTREGVNIRGGGYFKLPWEGRKEGSARQGRDPIS